MHIVPTKDRRGSAEFATDTQIQNGTLYTAWKWIGHWVHLPTGWSRRVLDMCLFPKWHCALIGNPVFNWHRYEFIGGEEEERNTWTSFRKKVVLHLNHWSGRLDWVSFFIVSPFVSSAGAWILFFTFISSKVFSLSLASPAQMTKRGSIH